MGWLHGVGAVIALALVVWALWRWMVSWRLLEPLGDVLGRVVGDLLKVRRRHVVTAMRRAGVLAPERAASLMYRSLGRGLLELLWVTARPRRRLDDLVEFDARLLERIRRSGAVIVTAHTGNWDLVGCAAAEHVKLTVVTKRLKIRFLDRLWQGARAARNIKLVEEGHVAEAVMPALRRGEVVAMLVDQAPERARAVARQRFLGEIAGVDLAPALIAMRARVPLVAAFARRLPDGTHTVEVPGILEPPPRASRAWAETAAKSVTEWLEEFVLREPSQWLWMHRRWKELPSLQADRARATSAP
jgi:KDO2-lipid IV(A) lauroyltransferase